MSLIDNHCLAALQAGVEHHLAGRLGAAETYYLRAAKHTSCKPGALGNLATLYKAQGRLEEAQILFAEAIQLDPRNAQTLHNYAGLLCSLEEYQQASAYERRAVNVEPTNAEFHTRLGYSLWKQGEHKAAIAATKQAIDLNPRSVTPLLNLGAIFRDQLQLERALQITLQAIEVAPHSQEAHENAGVILLQLGKPAESLRYLHAAHQLNPIKASVLLHLSKAMEQMGYLQQADALVREAVGLDPGDVEAFCMLSFLMFEQNRISDAIALAEHAANLQPQNANVYCQLSSYLRAKSRLQEAEVAARRALELEPDLAAAHCTLGSLLQSRGNLLEARQAFEAAISCPQPCCSAWFQLANQADKADAERWLSEISSIEAKPLPERDQVDLQFAVANLQIKLRRYEEASSALQKANALKLKRYGSDRDHYIQTTNTLIHGPCPDAATPGQSARRLFIVGMVRSGSTLTENILSLNRNTQDLGETSALPRAHQQWLSAGGEAPLDVLYSALVDSAQEAEAITIDKNLYNYRFSTVIAKQLPEARIIHCFRHPLDNILSMHRAHFSNGNRYASSIEDSAHVLLSQHDAMKFAKQRFPDRIFSQSYDSLVANPQQEIPRLIHWLGWAWNETYLNPHLNQRSVNTASVIQVRSPINARSLGGWKNFLDLLEPAVPILNRHPDFQWLDAEFAAARCQQASVT